MPYLYHAVPERMLGSTLYPLTALKGIAPELHDKYAAAYVGRESVMQHEIYPLGCLWNDAIFLCPVHPAKLIGALAKMGRRTGFRTYFEIDARRLDPELTTVYLHEKRAVDPSQFVSYDPETVCEDYGEIPSRTLRYYRASLRDNLRPMLWGYVPHVLYKGEIETQGCSIISF
jgi:hypothetical protein